MKRILSCGIIFLFLFLNEELNIWIALSVTLSAYTFLNFLYQIGLRFALLECIVFIAALEILLIPATTYWLLPDSMPVDSQTYFGYAFPAYVAFVLGINRFTQQRDTRNHRDYIQAITTYLEDKKQIGVWLFCIGLGGFILKMAFPAAPTIIGLLPSYCLFVSVLYAYYSRSSSFPLIAGAVMLVLVTYTIRQGMFGDLFFWAMLLGLMFTTGLERSITVGQKVVFIGLAFAALLLIQSVKVEYRLNTWGSQRSERSSDAGLMAELLSDRLANPEKVLNIRHLFSAFVRFNQGMMIGSAMEKVPMHEPFANGEVLLSFIYPFVPRLLWPGKPQTGGYENIRRFTSLPQHENTSMNLSPLGEGYVNFGYAGILFALAYGTLLGWIFQFLLRLSEQIPSVFLWIPALFFGCLTMETDLLSTWGSLLNCGIFVWLLYWSFPRFSIHL
ncbi:hypothetical protein GCM10028807_58320 [Spirosoma daeguense]